MPTPKEVVERVAAVFGVPVGTVAVHDRNLMESRVRSLAKRGRGNKAYASTSAAAHLIVAVAGSSSAKDTLETIAAFPAEIIKVRDALDAAIVGEGGVEDVFTLRIDRSSDLKETRQFTGATIDAIASLFA